MKILRWIAVAVAMASLTYLTGCTAIAPQYQTANANVQQLAGRGGKASVGVFDYGPKGLKLNQLSTRGTSYNSPVEKSWAAYLREATETGDAAVIAAALETVARARGIASDPASAPRSDSSGGKA